MIAQKDHKFIRIYIVEDEPLIAETAKMALESYGMKVLGISEDYDSALKHIQDKQANMVLLDINIQGEKDGVDLAMTLEKLNIPYLFITSQTDPSTLARVKETKPLGFLVKPFTDSGLLSNIELAWHKIALENEEYIIIRSEGERIKLNQASILYLKAFDNYCYIITLDREYLVPHTLKHTAEKLNAAIFKKSHRSYVINSQKIKGIKSDAVVVEDIDVPLSSTYKKDIENLLL
jgi:DNA-binding LytR/AlgR family response regulator